MNFFISDAYAQGAAGGPSLISSMILPIMLIVVFYFLLIRPQQKRAKEHRQMVEAVKKGDELVTAGGVLGRVTEVGESFIQLEVTDGVQLKIQKQSIATLMPKGTTKGEL